MFIYLQGFAFGKVKGCFSFFLLFQAIAHKIMIVD